MKEEKDGGNADVVLKLLQHLKENNMPVWLHGGWALEAYSGKSRPHSDIDLLADEQYRVPLRRLFTNNVLGQDIHKLVVEFESAYIEVTFFKPTRDGRMITTTPRIIVIWPPDTINHSHLASLNGEPVPVASPSAVYMEITNTVRKKQPMLDKNKRDRQEFGDLLSPDEKKQVEQFFPRENNLLNRLRLRFGM